MNKFLSDMLDCEFSHSLAYEPNLNDIPDITFYTPKKKIKTMNREKLAALYKKYDLAKDDIYKHKHYVIITRQGIDKIQAYEKINIAYDVIKCEHNFAVVKAMATVGDYTIQTFGSALKGATFNDGNTQTWYIIEMAEKRAMSRAVLKLTGFYELGVYSEDESEEFKKK